MADRRISSPAWTFWRPKVWATRLMLSVVPRVQMICLTLGALIRARTFSRASSKRSVASWLRVETPRCTLVCSKDW